MADPCFKNYKFKIIFIFLLFHFCWIQIHNQKFPIQLDPDSHPCYLIFFLILIFLILKKKKSHLFVIVVCAAPGNRKCSL